MLGERKRDELPLRIPMRGKGKATNQGINVPMASQDHSGLTPSQPSIPSTWQSHLSKWTEEEVEEKEKERGNCERRPKVGRSQHKDSAPISYAGHDNNGLRIGRDR